jgi:hypothetical protein
MHQYQNVRSNEMKEAQCSLKPATRHRTLDLHSTYAYNYLTKKTLSITFHHSYLAYWKRVPPKKWVEKGGQSRA